MTLEEMVQQLTLRLNDLEQRFRRHSHDGIETDSLPSSDSGDIDLTADVTGILPLVNGGTGAALVDPNADRILFWDDSAGEFTFLTPGTNLTITGTTLNATGAGAWEHISTYDVDSGDEDVVTLTVPSGYRILRLTAVVRQDNNAGTDSLLMRFNSDSGFNYNYQNTLGDNNTVSATRGSAISTIILGQGIGTNGVFNDLSVIINQPGASVRKTGHGMMGVAGIRVANSSFEWTNTADEIDEINISFQFGIGTRQIENGSLFILEGIA